ncbi:MAG TPA: hypothetical protein VHF89_04065 [Solirubrobacteraceae bacterium]|nr:hypothetical protein [Solirubrobacteraceae bacterium]
MATVQEPAPRAAERADAVTLVLLLVGASQLLTGAFAFFAPGSFYDVVAGYPPYNEHFLMDVGSWQIALGAIALYGARRAAWRVPLLALLALQYVLHLVPHLIHFDDAEKSGQAWFATIALALASVVLIGLFVRERSR